MATQLIFYVVVSFWSLGSCGFLVCWSLLVLVCVLFGLSCYCLYRFVVYFVRRKKKKTLVFECCELLLGCINQMFLRAADGTENWLLLPQVATSLRCCKLKIARCRIAFSQDPPNQHFG